MYTDWYVFYVPKGKELVVKEVIQKFTSEPITMNAFQREVLHIKKGKKVKVLGPLFNGYLFIHKKINKAMQIAQKYLPNEYIHPISMGGSPCKVFKEEMELLIKNTEANGIFKLSLGLKVNDKIEIMRGPLKNLQGNILWIDEKKNKAKVEIKLFKRIMRVNLGIEVCSEMPRTSLPG
ncbi:MAG: hypothetical protein JW969_02775 [Spirochaetales bacterium]|nr:hypothetical protein [Spirochaetales bacterium]